MITLERHQQTIQLPIPGFPIGIQTHTSASRRNVVPGQPVLYVGRLNGGPHYGTHGVIKEALPMKALVEATPISGPA